MGCHSLFFYIGIIGAKVVEWPRGLRVVDGLKSCGMEWEWLCVE